MELTRTTACEVEYWPTADPTLATGNRDMQFDAFRQVRDSLIRTHKDSGSMLVSFLLDGDWFGSAGLGVQNKTTVTI